MGQLLVVHSPDGRARESLMLRGLAACERVCGIVPAERLDDGATAVARFAPQQKSGIPLVRDAAGWTAGIGGWVRGGSRDAATLGELGAAMRGDDDGALASATHDLDGIFALVAGSRTAG